MSSAPLITTEEKEGVPELQDRKQQLKHCGKVCGIGCCGVVAVIFVLMWLVQGLMYWYATTLMGCRAGALQGFNYDGDAPSRQNPSYNLVPRISLLTERDPAFYFMAFDLFPSNEQSTLAGGKVGTWWRTWGPIFWTYTYEDSSSKTTIYMRRNLLRIGSSHRIARCDGQEPFITFTEGSNWLGNRIRTLFGFNQAMTFKIYSGNDLIAITEEFSSGGIPSLTFKNLHNDELGSSVLQSNNFHGHRDQWLVKNNETLNMPYFVSNAASLLFAFHRLAVEDSQPAAPAAFLADNSSTWSRAVPAVLEGNISVWPRAVPAEEMV